MSMHRLAAVLLAAAAFVGGARATSLRVAPVTIDLAAEQAATTINVWNDGAQPINVQVRVFRWRQENGEDVLEPTDDVVASPPIAALAPNAQNVIRIVRVAKTPVGAEESYRLLVDELPDPARRKAGAVTLVLRHSIPVFFASAAPTPAALSWEISREAGGWRLTASNRGGRHLKVTNLALDASGAPVARLDGLVGYVLGGATQSWIIAAPAASAGALSVSLDGQDGRVRAPVRASGG